MFINAAMVTMQRIINFHVELHFMKLCIVMLVQQATSLGYIV